MQRRLLLLSVSSPSPPHMQAKGGKGKARAVPEEVDEETLERRREANRARCAEAGTRLLISCTSPLASASQDRHLLSSARRERSSQQRHILQDWLVGRPVLQCKASAPYVGAARPQQCCSTAAACWQHQW